MNESFIQNNQSIYSISNQNINISNDNQFILEWSLTNLSTKNTSQQIYYFFNHYVNTLLKNPYKRVLLSLYIIILIFGTFINLLLIYTIKKLRNPKSLANRRMLLIRVLCDLALAWFGVPYTAYTAVYKNWLLGNIMCKISAFLIYFIVALNNFLLVAICLNRSVGISQNGKHLTDPTVSVPCRVKCLLVAAGLLALIIAFPGGIVSEQVQIKLPETMKIYFDLNTDISEMIPMICMDSWSREAQLAYDVILIVAIYVLPLIVVCLSQHVVTVHLKQSQRLLMLSGYRNTTAWTRRRQRLTRLCVLMAALFVLSWSPNHVCNLLTKTFHINYPVTEILLDYSMCLAMSNAVTGPLLLIATCSNYHRYIFRFFYRSSMTSHSTTSYSMPANSIHSSTGIGLPIETFPTIHNRVRKQKLKITADSCTLEMVGNECDSN
ncbi:hypothetical protein MS3_00004193 [Schistosoma haematobium]|uniref:G-protein coupled receptors family 1 profile domain-containing protein n=4 Tax=Schistosoma TaxID=6181 RepID=A0A922LRP6_SCHHA|nr:hypothetical protein MS3_00004193 [Schistosoma haematobium]KAH9592168.1 hypothetical protein MS3_00004193 [Schistosoma haematobium]CAH8675823.1 unnamed protein product [Schistosoma haematobium]CAH8679442.1 unnamed protein product [Schistosoma haematobium]